MNEFDPVELARLAAAVRQCGDQESKADADAELTAYCVAHCGAIVYAITRLVHLEHERMVAGQERADELAATGTWQADARRAGVELEEYANALTRTGEPHIGAAILRILGERFVTPL